MPPRPILVPALERFNDPAMVERFQGYVHVNEGDDACWLWTGATYRGGYGHMRVHGLDGVRDLAAHRIAWRLAHGEWPPDDRMVLHSCDMPPCVRLSHLFLGDHQINMQDAARKGRLALASHWRKLSPENVRVIRASAETQRVVAERLGITQQTVSDIRRRRSWGFL